RRAVYDYRTLGRLARAYRVNWQAGTTLDRVIIERSATTLSGEVIESHLIQELAQDMAVTPEELSVTLDNRSTSVALPIDAAPTLAIRRMVHDPISGRFTATIVAPAEGPTLYEATLTGRTVPIISLPVLAAPLRNGDVIKDRDLITLKVPAERVNGTVIIDREDLIGMTPRRSVSANTPIRDADIHAPIVVERGTPVTIRLNHGAIALTAKGRAMDDAARGDILRVMNVASNRIVDAIAIGPNAVQVTLP
ncbi:MAG: flagellar basal body P-ring formation chaperone FlgA, partial [Pseudomonadota bacterium]